ncbi:MULTISPECIES: hypothetical protein [Streptomyces]|uniref:Uncharacterized protein n=2 Tax=Streptomyces TaxID=1883 RepID=A0ABV9IU11_9ACTN
MLDTRARIPVRQVVATRVIAEEAAVGRRTGDGSVRMHANGHAEISRSFDGRLFA